MRVNNITEALDVALEFFNDLSDEKQDLENRLIEAEKEIDKLEAELETLRDGC